jgi:hypothetical protein
MMMTAGKCSQQVDLSGENINITYKPDGTHIAVGNRVSSLLLSFCLFCDSSHNPFVSVLQNKVPTGSLFNIEFWQWYLEVNF